MLFLFPPCFFPCLFLSFFSHSIQLHAQFKTTFHYDPYTHFDALRRLRQQLIGSLRRVINKKSCSHQRTILFKNTTTPFSFPGKLLQFEYAVIELSSFSRTPERFSFPRSTSSTVAAASCHLTLLPLQNTGFRFSFPRTLLADRRSFFLSLTWARISSSLFVSLLLYKGNKNCDECNRVAYFDARYMAGKRKLGCRKLESNYYF